MKKLPKNIRFRFYPVQIVMVLLLKTSLVFGQNLDKKQVVVIDPGHGGKDSGALGINQLKEKDVVLDIAKAILELNKKLGTPLDIYLTRYSDTLISLTDRAKLAKVLGADLFVSLHCNHSDDPNTRGVEVYVSKQKNKYSDQATWLAFQLQDGLNKRLGFESRGVKFAGFQVLREMITYCPSVLLELGFLSHMDEGGYLKKKENYKKVSLLIVNYLISLPKL